jgi:hypothetical protein
MLGLFLDFWMMFHSGVCAKTSRKKTKATGSLRTEAKAADMQLAE